MKKRKESIIISHSHGERKKKGTASLTAEYRKIITGDVHVVFFICDITYPMIVINIHVQVFELSVVLLQKNNKIGERFTS